MTQDRLWELLAKKLSGEATLPEMDELQGLLRKSPDLHYPLQTISDLWFQPVSQTEDTEAAYDRHLVRMNTSGVGIEETDTLNSNLSLVSAAGETSAENSASNDEMDTLQEMEQYRRRRRFRLASAVAIVLALLGGGWFLFQPVKPQLATIPADSAMVSEISTRNGSKSKVVLPDGSQVWLNSGSKITYGKEFGATAREVNLTGEAFFDVVKNPEKPFIIHARDIDIRVVGTAFNVKSYPGDKTTETSLIRGIIEVNIRNRPKEKIILKPNEKLVVASNEPQPKTIKPVLPAAKPAPQVVIDNISYLPADSTVIETSWMDNKLIFRNESFRELANRMERWYGVSIQFDNTKLEEVRFNGTFQGETLQQALRALTITAPFVYKINKEVVTITSKP